MLFEDRFVGLIRAFSTPLLIMLEMAMVVSTNLVEELSRFNRARENFIHQQVISPANLALANSCSFFYLFVLAVEHDFGDQEADARHPP